MRAMGTPLITAKNQLWQDHPWIFLFEVEYQAGSDPWRYAAYPTPISWNGYSWEAMSAAVEIIEQDSSGRLAELNVIAENVSRKVSAYQENYDLRGKPVTVYLVNHGCLEETTVLSWAYQVNNVQRKATEAVIELGHPDLFSLEIPRWRHIRDRCWAHFRDDRCRYPEDWFDDNTEQDLILGGDSNKGGGWATLNIANADIADVNQTKLGKLVVQTKSGGPFRFSGASRDAPQVYKVFKGNFDFYARVSTAPTAESSFGFYAQAATSLGDYAAWLLREIGGADHIVTSSSVGGIVTDTTQTLMKRNLRITRAGSTIVWKAKADDDADWTTYKTEVLISIGHGVRVGFVFPTPTSAAGNQIEVDYFKAFGGGLQTCSYGFDTPNGCKEHMNTPNFVGAAGLPYGPLQL